jgi:hypothetical protein
MTRPPIVDCEDRARRCGDCRHFGEPFVWNTGRGCAHYVSDPEIRGNGCWYQPAALRRTAMCEEPADRPCR